MRWHWLIAVALVVVGVLTWGCGGTLGPTGRVTGYVQDATSHDPITGALVKVGGKSGHTDNWGQFDFQAPVGDHDVEVYASGYLGGIFDSIRVVENQPTYVDTIYLTRSQTIGDEEVVYLADLEPAGGWDVYRGNAHLGGIFFLHAVYDDRWWNPETIEWNIGMQFKHFKTTLGVSDDQDDPQASVAYQIYGDGELLHTSPELKVGDVDVVNVAIDSVLRLNVTISHINGYPTFVMGDPRITRPKS